MLDVHPPEQTPHNWHEFFIHIATIVVGLVIAVGLEQGVEAIHRQHLRKELSASLLEDTQKALRDNQDMERNTLNHTQWLTARINDTILALRANTHPHYIALVPVRVRSTPVFPNWKAAKSSNLVEVLPQDDVKAFAEVDDSIDELMRNYRTTEFIYRRIAFEQRFRTSGADNTLDFSHATRDDLNQDLALLSEERSNAAESYLFTLYLRGCLTAVINGERDLDRIDDAENSARDQGLKQVNQVSETYRSFEPPSPASTH
jgi:hypothetical protein